MDIIAIILLIFWGVATACLMYAIGKSRGYREGYDIAWKQVILHRAIWKEAYIRLWEKAYPKLNNAVYLTTEEQAALDTLNKEKS